MKSLLIANRGEVAVRIARAAADLGLQSVAVYSEDDAASKHVLMADRAERLSGSGVRAYLDIDQLLDAAERAGCDAIHPGYGFLSESAEFARRCAERGLTFIGPTPEALELLGDKAEARALAQRLDVPVLPGTSGPTSLEEAEAFFDQLPAGGAAVLKAIAGGGGRGMRIVRSRDELASAYSQCQAEAAGAFGRGDLYIEEFLPQARHIEVQIVGDGSGRAIHLWERECTLQRRNQKLVEIAPSPTLDAALREQLLAAAVRMAEAVKYLGLGTFEFLVDPHAPGGGRFFFMEANPRLQVEHTVTEEVTGLDLVVNQIRLVQGHSLAELGLTADRIPSPRGYAVQVRVNMETIGEDGVARPSGGTLTAFEPPTGPGIRVDTFGYAGYTTNPLFDSLLAKVIAYVGQDDYAAAVARTSRALADFRIEGVASNIPFLRALLERPEVARNDVHTRFVDENVEALVRESARQRRTTVVAAAGAESAASGASVEQAAPPGTTPVTSHVQGAVVAVLVSEGETVRKHQEIALIEAMKMQYAITASVGGIVRAVAVARGDIVAEGQALIHVEESEVDAVDTAEVQEVDLDAIRPDLAEVIERHRLTQDEARPEAVAKRHKLGMRTARENIADLVDPGSFVEYGALTFAAQRARRSIDDLIKNTPADGLITGIGTVNADLFGKQRSRCMVLSYDYTVLAGTQGTMNHKKTDRMLALAEQQRLPIVFFTEGGGGRPGDTDNKTKVAGLDLPTFQAYARLSGLVPRIAVVAGRCFAGNASLAGCSDIIIATDNTTIGMGGPAMIEGGGLGVYKPEEVGPVNVQEPNGVLDIVVRDEAEATARAKQALSYFQGAIDKWECEDQRQLRWSIPEDRLRAYDVRALINILADTGSVLELRPKYAPGMITAFIRIEGRPMGLLANVPTYNGGAIDGDGADKAARFVQLCDAFDIPILSLCDTPGFLVGPEAEKTALVRRTSRMFVTAASITVPYFTVVLRKGYGLGALAMACGNFHHPVFTVAWPTGEFGGMGLEGGVRLGFRKELEAIEDPEERQALYDKLVAEAYERGKAVSMAASLEIDAVIDPMETRAWIVRGLDASAPTLPRNGKKRPFVDTW